MVPRNLFKENQGKTFQGDRSVISVILILIE